VIDAEEARIHQGKVPNPLADFDIQKFINDPIDADKEIPISAIQRSKVPNPLSPHIFSNDPINVEETNQVKLLDTQSESNILDNQRSRELENTFTDFVSHQTSNGDKKHTNTIINEKEANPIINVNVFRIQSETLVSDMRQNVTNELDKINS